MMKYEIKAAMALAQITVSAIARTEGVTPSIVSQVISGKAKSPRIRAAIALAINRPVDEVFPVTPEQA